MFTTEANTTKAEARAAKEASLRERLKVAIELKQQMKEVATETKHNRSTYIFSAAKPMKATKTPSKLDVLMLKIEMFMCKVGKKIDNATARAKPYAIKMVRLASKLLKQILIWGILINIAAVFWPDLKEEIPYIYGFFDGCLQIAEEFFRWLLDILKDVGVVFEKLKDIFV